MAYFKWYASYPWFNLEGSNAAIVLENGCEVGLHIGGESVQQGFAESIYEAEALRIAQLFNISIEEARRCR